MSNIKVCSITTVTISMDIFMIHIAKNLKDYGLDVSLMCNMDKAYYEYHSKDYKCVSIPMARNMNVISAVRSIYKMYRYFKTEKINMIQYTTPNASLYAAIAGIIAKVPIRVYCQWGLRYEGFSGFKYKIFKFLENLTCRLSTTVEPDSFATLVKCLENKMYNEEKGYVVLNGSAIGIDLNTYNEQSRLEWRDIKRNEYKFGTSDFVFGYFGRICRDKGINELLAAYKRIENEFLNTKLIIVGSEDNLSEINMDLYKWAKDNNNIKFVGNVYNPWVYYSTLDAYVSPSYREGFGNTIIEAQAMGIPVISSDIDGPREGLNFGKNGLLVPPQNIEALYNAMKLLLTDQFKIDNYTKLGKEYVEEKYAKDKLMEAIYHDRLNLFKSKIGDKL
jgi:glycosyltransferase involved in cell wall biosynthesis